MATADLITAFLSNEMSPEGERQFLLSVAASDALRLELKSHLMIDRMMGEQVHRAQVPDAVRMAIFAQAGVAVGASASAPSASASQSAELARAAASARPGFFSRFIGRASILGTALAVFGIGYAIGVDNVSEANPTPAQSEASAPAVRQGNDVVESVLPSTVAVPNTENLSSTAPPARETPRVVDNRVGTRSSVGVNESPVNAGAQNVEPAVTSEPATTSTDTRTDRRNPRVLGRSTPVTAEGEVRKPTDAERNGADPLNSGGTPVK